MIFTYMVALIHMACEKNHFSFESEVANQLIFYYWIHNIEVWSMQTKDDHMETKGQNLSIFFLMLELIIVRHIVPIFNDFSLLTL